MYTVYSTMYCISLSELYFFTWIILILVWDVQNTAEILILKYICEIESYLK